MVPDESPAEAQHIRPLQLRDPAVMRALAHPARLAVLEHLMSGAEATATECAEVCGLSPSATSYHLRALAKAGIIEEAPSRGDARERVWRSAVRGLEIEPGAQASEEQRDAANTLLESFLIRHEARMRHWLANRDVEPPEWYEAAQFTESHLMVTADELRDLADRVREVVRPYLVRTRPTPPPGARRVATLFQAFPVDQPLPSGDVKH
ncbi:MAG TPA: metalloregulator ArsR/SmtB family transcription factor [Micromonosporaceae bacterium]